MKSVQGSRYSLYSTGEILNLDSGVALDTEDRLREIDPYNQEILLLESG